MFIQPGRPASPGPWGGLDYHSVNWCNYSCNTWLRRSRPAVCLHSTATTRKLYLKRIEVFFLIVVVNNGDLSSFKKQNVSYPFHGRVPVWWLPVSYQVVLTSLCYPLTLLGGEKFGESHCLAKNPKMIQAGLELRSFQHPPHETFS